MGEAPVAGILRAGHQANKVVISERVSDRADHPACTYSVRALPVREAQRARNWSSPRSSPATPSRWWPRSPPRPPVPSLPAVPSRFWSAWRLGSRRPLRGAAARGLAGDPGDAQHPALVGEGISAPASPAGSPPPSTCPPAELFTGVGASADRSGEPDGRGDSGVGIRAGLLLPLSSKPRRRRVAAGPVARLPPIPAVQTMAGLAAMLLTAAFAAGPPRWPNRTPRRPNCGRW